MLYLVLLFYFLYIAVHVAVEYNRNCFSSVTQYVVRTLILTSFLEIHQTSTAVYSFCPEGNVAQSYFKHTFYILPRLFSLGVIL
jgi:hypothetical protein